MFRLEGKHLGDRASLEARLGRAMQTLWIAYQPIVSWSRAIDVRVRGAGPQRGADAALAARPVRGRRAAGTAAGARARRSRSRRAHARRAADGRAAVHQPARDGAGRRFADLGDGAAVAARAAASSWRSRSARRWSRSATSTARVAQLRALGYRIAVDDLGAGYAGLTSFAHLEPEVVKVDMSLIRGIDRSPMKQKLLAFDRDPVPRARHPDHRRGRRDGGGARRAGRDRRDLCQGYLFARPDKPWTETVRRSPLTLSASVERGPIALSLPRPRREEGWVRASRSRAAKPTASLRYPARGTSS